MYDGLKDQLQFLKRFSRHLQDRNNLQKKIGVNPNAVGNLGVRQLENCTRLRAPVWLLRFGQQFGQQFGLRTLKGVLSVDLEEAGHSIIVGKTIWKTTN